MSTPVDATQAQQADDDQAAYVREVVASAPPLSDDQRALLARLFNPSTGGEFR